MKIVLLHISDIHFEAGLQDADLHLTKIVHSLRSFGGFKKILIILSGDLTFSGTVQQFLFLNIHITSLISKIEEEFNISPEIICVPGNHDLNHPKTAALTYSELQQIYDTNKYSERLPDELRKLDNYFNFCARFNSDSTRNSLCTKKIIEFDKFKIKVNLINNAVFSLKKENYKGLLFIDVAELCRRNKELGSDYNLELTVMHHSYDWYTDSIKNEIEKLILKNSSLVFVGHEHVQNAKEISSINGDSTKIIQGGEFGSSSNWDNSCYNVLLLDSTTLKVDHWVYSWNIISHQYQPNEDGKISYSLSEKKYKDFAFVPKTEYIEALVQNDRNDDLGPLYKYYVFPRIAKDFGLKKSGIDILSFNELMEELHEKKEILITGNERTGKTSLMKMIFYELYMNHSTMNITCILLDSEDFRKSDFDMIIKSKFEEIYGYSQTEYHRFTQLPKTQKLLIVDNINNIEDLVFDKFKKFATDQFGLRLFLSSKIINFNIESEIKASLLKTDSNIEYRLPMFYIDKKKELVSRVVALYDPSGESSVLYKVVIDWIDSNKRTISSSPDFIIKYIQFCYNSHGADSSNPNNVFSRVFEANITNALAKFATPKLQVDKIVIILQRVAFQIHENKQYPFEYDFFHKIVEKYKEENGSNFDTSKFLNILINSKILVESEDKYKFADVDYLAYFIAKEILNNDTEIIHKHVLKISELACFDINSTILLFIIYLCENKKLLLNLLEFVENSTLHWGELVIPDNLPNYLSTSPFNSSHYDMDNKELKKKESEKADIELDRKAEVNKWVVDLYDYNEHDVETLYNQIVRSCTLMSIVSRSLPAFEHRLNVDEKKRFVKQIYSLPNKIFLMWATEVQKIKAQFTEYLLNEWYTYSTEMSEDDLKKTIDEVFVEQSIRLLLNLYNIATSQATSETTISLLMESPEQEKSLAHEVERLMVAERFGQLDLFQRKALELESIDERFTKELLRRVVYHALMNMSAIGYSQAQQLVSKYFHGKQNQKFALAERKRSLFRKK